MKNVDMILEELRRRGFSVDAYEVNKVDRTLTGVYFNGGQVSPLFYIEDYTDGKEVSVSDICDSIVTDYLRCSYQEDGIREQSLAAIDPENLKDNIHIGFAKTADTDIIARPSIFEGIMEYMFIPVVTEKDTGRITVNAGLAEDLGIAPAELWKMALANTLDDVDFVDLSELDLAEPCRIFAISNGMKSYGASAILNEDVLRMIAAKLGTDTVLALPESVDQFLVMVCDEASEIICRHMTEMNANFATENRLIDQAYIIDLSGKKMKVRVY